MKYAQSFTGNTSTVIAAARAFAAEARLAGGPTAAKRKVADAKARQVEAAARAVDAALSPYPPNLEAEATVAGEIDADGTGTYSYSASVQGAVVGAAAELKTAEHHFAL